MISRIILSCSIGFLLVLILIWEYGPINHFLSGYQYQRIATYLKDSNGNPTLSYDGCNVPQQYQQYCNNITIRTVGVGDKAVQYDIALNALVVPDNPYIARLDGLAINHSGHFYEGSPIATDLTWLLLFSASALGGWAGCSYITYWALSKL